MHIIAILIGLVLGSYVGERSDALFGALLGALAASLFFRLGDMRAMLSALQRRLEILERKQAEKPAVNTRPEPLPPVAKETPAPEKVVPADIGPADEPPKPRVHEHVPESPPLPGPFDRVVGIAKRWLTTGNVPVKIGIVISFFGVAFLLKYAVENSNIEIPISARYTGVALFAALLMGIGWRMRDTQRTYALSLQGGGIGVLFLTVFAAFQLHDLLPPVVAFAILILADGHGRVSCRATGVPCTGNSGYDRRFPGAIARFER